jgi:phage tail-like protein
MDVYYPPTGFCFRVAFTDVEGTGEDAEQRFQEVSGLSYEITTEDVNEGGQNGFTQKLPKRVKYPNLVLKRGLVKNTALLKWFESAKDTFFMVAVYDFKPKDIMITLLDEADQPVAIWNVVQAYPLKWSTSDLKASDNSIVIETIELAYQYFTRQEVK